MIVQPVVEPMEQHTALDDTDEGWCWCREVEQEFTRRVQQLVTNTDLSVPTARLITAR